MVAIAQLAEHRTVAPGVAGSSPAGHLGGAVAQLGERVNGIDEVRGSNPLGSIPAALAQSVERAPRKRQGIGSSPMGGSIKRGQQALVAQSVAQAPCKRRVVGSSPTEGLVGESERAWCSGSTSPSQGEGRGFESRRPLFIEGAEHGLLLFHKRAARLNYNLKALKNPVGGLPMGFFQFCRPGCQTGIMILIRKQFRGLYSGYLYFVELEESS